MCALNPIIAHKIKFNFFCYIGILNDACYAKQANVILFVILIIKAGTRESKLGKLAAFIASLAIIDKRRSWITIILLRGKIDLNVGVIKKDNFY